MSNTQANHGFSFRILPEVEHEQFRLLELPPAVLDLIAKDGPSSIHIKSRDPASDVDGRDNNAVLCTPTSSYQIRQVNHSNSVYITRPRKDRDEENQSDNFAVEAFATNNFVLELIPIAKESAIDDLKSILPVYTSTGSFESKDLRQKNEVLDDIPASQAECDRAWKQLACFELREPKGSFRLSASVRMKVWLNMTSFAVAESIDITQPLTKNQLESLTTANEDYPPELSRAVLDVMLDDSLTINLEECLRFVGASHLEERTRSAGETSLDGFLESWADAMPEKWRAKVDIDLIKDVCHISDTSKGVSFIDGTAKAKADASASDGAKASLGAKRKWHEKFRSSSKRTT